MLHPMGGVIRGHKKGCSWVFGGLGRGVYSALFVIPPTPDGSWLWLCDNCKSRCSEYPIQSTEWHFLLLLILLKALPSNGGCNCYLTVLLIYLIYIYISQLHNHIYKITQSLIHFISLTNTIYKLAWNIFYLILFIIVQTPICCSFPWIYYPWLECFVCCSTNCIN